MIRIRANLIAMIACVAAAGLAFSISGCRGGSAGPAAAVPEPTPFAPRLVKQQGSPELLEFNCYDVNNNEVKFLHYNEGPPSRR